MAEQYIENVIIRQDGEEVLTPSFDDTDVDSNFEIDAIIQLKQIIKSVQNNIHNKHDYVFVIKNITKLQKEV